MKQTMGEFQKGKLRSGSKDGPKVTSPKQAIAIGLKESGQSKKSAGSKKKPSDATPSKSAARRKKLESVTF